MLCSLNLFALELFADENKNDIGNRLVVMIPKQEDNSLKIPALNLKIGESGIITRTINNNEFIIANVIVKHIQDDIATLEVSQFDTMREKYMPQPLGTPQEKDKVIFRILYNRAILIAPNQTTYQSIAESRGNIDFIHPDIFATYLAKNNINMPLEKDFKGFCDTFDVGLIIIATDNESYTLDCQSFAKLKQEILNIKDNSQNLPFFTRLSSESLDRLFDIQKMQDYFGYYKNLIDSHTRHTK